MRYSWMIVIAGSLALAACREPRVAAEVEATGEAVPVDSTEPFSDGVNRATALEQPPNIYYDLMRFEWYAQGKPLIHDGQTYLPGGMPVAMELANLTRVGEYEGVDYYIPRAADSQDLIYVPVFEGYWLPFGPTAPVALPAND